LIGAHQRKALIIGDWRSRGKRSEIRKSASSAICGVPASTAIGRRARHVGRSRRIAGTAMDIIDRGARCRARCKGTRV
jgi:hypothetical protein